MAFTRQDVANDLGMLIDTTMAKFDAKTASIQLQEHQRGVNALKEALIYDRVEEDKEYFIGRYDVANDSELKGKIATEEKREITLSDESVFKMNCYQPTVMLPLKSREELIKDKREGNINSIIARHIADKLGLPIIGFSDISRLHIQKSSNPKFVKVSMYGKAINHYVISKIVPASEQEEIPLVLPNNINVCSLRPEVYRIWAKK